MTILRRPFLMVIVVLAAVAAAPSAAGAADPIEGTWIFGGGLILVDGRQLLRVRPLGRPPHVGDDEERDDL